MSGSETFTLTIPDDAWWDTEGDGSRLLAVLNINGTLHHLEAIRVIDRDSEQRAWNDEFEEALGALYQFGGDGAFETTEIRGAAYVIAMTPFQSGHDMQIHIVALNVEGNQVGAWATVHADKADALAEKLEAFYGGADDYFVGVYVAAVTLEADIETGPTNLIGIPLIDRSAQQSLF